MAKPDDVILSEAAAAEDGHAGYNGDSSNSDSELRTKEFEADMEIVSKTSMETGLTSANVNQLREKYGFNELAEEKKSPLMVFLGYFWGPMPIMIWLAIVIEFARAIADNAQGNPAGEAWADFGVLLILQVINGVVGFIEEHNAGNAIAALKEQLAPQCFVKRDGQWSRIPSRELVPGDFIQLKLGDIVPADAILLGEGNDSLDIDQAALTGESLPVTIHHHEKVKMGSSVKRGELDAVVTGTGANTFFGKAAGMIASVDEHGHFQKLLFKITLVLLGISVVLCVAILIYLLTAASADALRAIGIVVVLLVASIPIAMQVVATSTMAVGARKLASKKVIVARLSAIEELAGMSILCSDKTGTLTKNKLDLRPPLLMGSMDEQEIIFHSTLAARRVAGNQDAIDFCIAEKCYTFGADFKERLDRFEQLDFSPFSPETKRTEVISIAKSNAYDFKTAPENAPKEEHMVKITKGAPQVILRMCLNDPLSPMSEEEKNDLETRVSASIQELADRGFRALGVAIKRSTGAINRDDIEANDFGAWEFEGLLSLFDPPRDDTKSTIQKALKQGIDVKMVTGDQTAIAKETCRSLKMGANILSAELLNDTSLRREIVDEHILNSNGFAEVMPQDKFDIVNAIRQQGFTVGMTGDGVNDAPALKRADIGIAVEGATDAARAAADIVLTEPGLSVIIDAIERSRKIFQRLRNYVMYRLAATIELLLFFFFAIIAINPNSNTFYSDHQQLYIADSAAPGGVRVTWENAHDRSFVLPVISLVIITVLNDGTIITISHDRVATMDHPQHWDMKQVSSIALVEGLIACIGSLILVIVAFKASFYHYCAPTLQTIQDAQYQVCTFTGGNSFAARALGNGNYVPYGMVQTLVYLKISLSDFMTVFSVRCRWFFFERRPGNSLMAAGVFATLLSSILALVWPSGLTDGAHPTQNMSALKDVSSGHSVGTIWVYALINFAVQDICKVGTYWLLSHIDTERLERFKIFHRQRSIAAAASSYEHVARSITKRGAGTQDIIRSTTSVHRGRAGSNIVDSTLARVDNLEREIASLKKMMQQMLDSQKQNS